MLELGRHTHMVAALNHIATREMGLNWADAMDRLAFIDIKPSAADAATDTPKDQAAAIVDITLNEHDPSVVDGLFLDAVFGDELAQLTYADASDLDAADAVFSHLNSFDDAYTYNTNSRKENAHLRDPLTSADPAQPSHAHFAGLTKAERAKALTELYFSRLTDDSKQTTSHTGNPMTTNKNTDTHTNTTQSPSSAFTTSAFIALAERLDVLKFGEFELKSGRISPYFFNAGLLNDGEALSLLASGFAASLANKINFETDLIFGAAYKGIPFVAATAQALHTQYGKNVGWGFNRKEAKAHGEGGQMVGAPVAGKAVWVLDDVMTAGTAMREVIALLEAAGATIAGIIIALDRKEKGTGDTSAIEEFRAAGFKVEALVSIDDIIDYLKAAGNTEALAAMQAYRDKYGVA